MKLILLQLFVGVLLLSSLAQADNVSSVNLIGDGSFDVPGPSLGSGAPWQAFSAWGSVKVETETGRKYADYEIRGGSRPSYTRTIKCLSLHSVSDSNLVGAETTVLRDSSIRKYCLIA